MQVQSTIVREVFDPKSKKHRESYKKFLVTGSWGDVQFHAEYPYTTVPETVHRKFAAHALKIHIKSDR